MELTQLVYARMKRRGHGVVVNDIGNSGENWDANYIAGSTANACARALQQAGASRIEIAVTQFEDDVGVRVRDEMIDVPLVISQKKRYGMAGVS